jgi:hypothetical protein
VELGVKNTSNKILATKPLRVLISIGALKNQFFNNELPSKKYCNPVVKLKNSGKPISACYTIILLHWR